MELYYSVLVESVHERPPLGITNLTRSLQWAKITDTIFTGWSVSCNYLRHAIKLTDRFSASSPPFLRQSHIRFYFVAATSFSPRRNRTNPRSFARVSPNDLCTLFSGLLVNLGLVGLLVIRCVDNNSSALGRSLLINLGLIHYCLSRCIENGLSIISSSQFLGNGVDLPHLEAEPRYQERREPQRPRGCAGWTSCCFQ